jgi:hypothetical protein
MEAIILLAVLVIGLSALGLGSNIWGVDSRDELPDTHTR